MIANPCRNVKALGFATDDFESHLRLFSKKSTGSCLSLNKITLAASLTFDPRIKGKAKKRHENLSTITKILKYSRKDDGGLYQENSSRRDEDGQVLDIF